MMRLKRAVLFCAVVSVGCDPFSGPDAADPISEAAVLAHVDLLAADSLRGRGSGSTDELRAATYIRDQFIDYGLDPGAPDYFQRFEFEPRILASGGESGPASAESAMAALPSQNVLGVLRGRGQLAGQWVILGAHYDHVGFVQVSSDSTVVYNGADDNASGTSLMLEIARFLSEYYRGADPGERGHRSLMFQAYGAEEQGLIGSNYFTWNPTVSMDSVVAMLNLDMVGRLRDESLTIVGASSSPVWGPLLTAKNETGLILETAGFLGGSDHYPFLLAGKPVLFFFTGLHAEYHTPADDSWLLNGAGTIRIGDLVVAVLQDLATRPDPPTFVAP